MNTLIDKISLKTIFVTVLLSTFWLISSGDTVQAAFNGYLSMPNRLPEDNSQYVTVSGRDIIDDNTGGNSGIGSYNYVYFVIYTSSPANKKLTITPVDRAVRTSGSVSNCAMSLNFYYGSSPSPTTKSSGLNIQDYNNDQCNQTKTVPNVFPASLFSEYRENGKSTGLYKGYIGIRTTDSRQATFKVGVPDSDVRIGYQGNQFLNIYSSALNPNERFSVDFDWRAPCATTRTTQSISFDDGNEPPNASTPDGPGTPYYGRDRTIQPYGWDGKATLYNYIPGSGAYNPLNTWEALTHDYNYSTSISRYGSGNIQTKAYKMKFINVRGGNGIGFKLPFDSGDAQIECPTDDWATENNTFLNPGIGPWQAPWPTTPQRWSAKARTAFNNAVYNHNVYNKNDSSGTAPNGQHKSFIEYRIKRASGIWRNSENANTGTGWNDGWARKTDDAQSANLSPGASFDIHDKYSSNASKPRAVDVSTQEDDLACLLYNQNPSNASQCARSYGYRKPIAKAERCTPSTGDSTCVWYINNYYRSAGDMYCERVVTYHYASDKNDSDYNYSSQKCIELNGSSDVTCKDWQVQHNEYTSGPHAVNDAWVGDSYTFYHNFWYTGHASQTPDIGFTRYKENGQSDGLGLHSLGLYNPSFPIGPFGPQDAGRTFESNVGFGPMASIGPDHCSSGGTGYSTAESVSIPYFYHLYPKATVSSGNIQQSEPISVTTTMTQPGENNEPGTNDIGRLHTYTNALSYRTIECTIPSGTQPWSADTSANSYHWTDSGLGPTAFGASKGGQNCQEVSSLGGDGKIWQNNISNEPINSNYETRNGNNSILPVGTKICYFLSVSNGAYDGLNGPKNQWRHGEPSCTTITKSPKVRFENSDVLTGRQIPKSANDADCDPLKLDSQIRTAGTTAYIVSTPIIAGGPELVNQTGSWGEYGVFATGNITGFGSAAYASGQNANDVKKLHFGNQTPNGNFRSYGSPCTFNWFEKLTKNAANISNASVTIDSLAGKTSQRSENSSWNVSASSPLGDITTPTILYAKATNGENSCKNATKDGSGVIEITSDITYKASYPNIKDIPRVILMADCGIIIHKNVRNIDAGLITRGIINTCDARESGSVISLYTDKNYGLTKDDCRQDIRITGPVVTKKINLLRTSNSDMTTPSASLLIPAEDFAQNPSYLISTYEQARQKVNLTVEYQDELPPRY